MQYVYKRRFLGTTNFENIILEVYVSEDNIRKQLAYIAHDTWGSGNWIWKDRIKKGNWESPPPFNSYVYCNQVNILGYGETIKVEWDIAWEE